MSCPLPLDWHLAIHANHITARARRPCPSRRSSPLLTLPCVVHHVCPMQLHLRAFADPLVSSRVRVCQCQDAFSAAINVELHAIEITTLICRHRSHHLGGDITFINYGAPRPTMLLAGPCLANPSI